MGISDYKGSIFLSRANMIGHGVNCRGFMGAGIALEVAKQFGPDMVNSYKDVCKNGELVLGGVHYWKASNDRFLANMATQFEPGPNADLGAVADTMDHVGNFIHNFREFYRTDFVLALPRIGAGIGGLKWDNVRGVIEEATDKWNLDVEIWSL